MSSPPRSPEDVTAPATGCHRSTSCADRHHYVIRAQKPPRFARRTVYDRCRPAPQTSRPFGSRHEIHSGHLDANPVSFHAGRPRRDLGYQ
ncbi:hypothetical protein MRX96_031226 [Rhipicephalus microplus]